MQVHSAFGWHVAVVAFEAVLDGHLTSYWHAVVSSAVAVAPSPPPGLQQTDWLDVVASALAVAKGSPHELAQSNLLAAPFSVGDVPDAYPKIGLHASLFSVVIVPDEPPRIGLHAHLFSVEVVPDVLPDFDWPTALFSTEVAPVGIQQHDLHAPLFSVEAVADEIRALFSVEAVADEIRADALLPAALFSSLVAPGDFQHHVYLIHHFPSRVGCCCYSPSPVYQHVYSYQQPLGTKTIQIISTENPIKCDPSHINRFDPNHIRISDVTGLSNNQYIHMAINSLADNLMNTLQVAQNNIGLIPTNSGVSLLFFTPLENYETLTSGPSAFINTSGNF